MFQQSRDTTSCRFHSMLGTWLYEAETVTSDGKYALLTFLRGPQGITFLDGLSQTIYDMNRRAPLLIDTKDRAEAYQ